MLEKLIYTFYINIFSNMNVEIDLSAFSNRCLKSQKKHSD